MADHQGKQDATFNGNITLGLQDGLAIKMSKSYNLISFKTLTGVDADTNLYTLLGLNDDYCTLLLDTKKKAITLQITNLDEWQKYLKGEDDETSAAVATAAAEEAAAEETAEAESEEQQPAVTTLPVQQVADLEALIAKVSDMLMLSTWGTAKASRAFVDSIGNRGHNATIGATYRF